MHIILPNGAEMTPETDIRALLDRWHATAHPPAEAHYLPTSGEATHEVETVGLLLSDEVLKRELVTKQQKVTNYDDADLIDKISMEVILMTIKTPFDIENFRPYADKHRGKYVRSGPHWPLVLRYPVLFDEVERLTIELKSKEIIIKGQREQINRFAAKLQKEHELSDEVLKRELVTK